MPDNSVNVKIETNAEGLAKEIAEKVVEEIKRTPVDLTKWFEMYMEANPHLKNIESVTIGETIQKSNNARPFLKPVFGQSDVDNYGNTITGINRGLSGMNPNNSVQMLKELEPMLQDAQAFLDKLTNADMGELLKLDFSKLNLAETVEVIGQLKTALGDEGFVGIMGMSPDKLEQINEYLNITNATLGETSEILDEVKKAEQSKNVREDYWLDSKTGILSGALNSFSGKNRDTIVEQIYTGKGDAAMTAISTEIIKFAKLRSMEMMITGIYESAMVILDTDNSMSGGVPHSTKAAYAFAAAAALGAFSWATDQGWKMNGELVDLNGKAHDGFDSIPYEGTWLLDKGERVVDSRTNADLKQFLSNKSRGDINLTVNINGGDKDSVMEALPALQKIIKDVVVGDIVSGGQIKRVIKEYR